MKEIKGKTFPYIIISNNTNNLRFIFAPRKKYCVFQSTGHYDHESHHVNHINGHILKKGCHEYTIWLTK